MERPFSSGIRPEIVYEKTYARDPQTSALVSAGDRYSVLGPNPDERLIWIGTDGVVSYPHTDRLGSTIALSKNGAAAEKFSYGPWGESASPATGYQWRYTGQRWNPFTQLYHYKAREYSVELGRFLQNDPLRFKDGPNMYAYVGNSPLNSTDPTGLICERKSGECSVRDERDPSRRGDGQAGEIKKQYEAYYKWARENPDAVIEVRADNVAMRDGSRKNFVWKVTGANIAAALENTDVALADRAYGDRGGRKHYQHNADALTTDQRDLPGPMRTPGTRFRTVYADGANRRHGTNYIVAHEIGWSTMLRSDIHQAWPAWEGQDVAGRAPRNGSKRGTGFAESLVSLTR